MRKGQHHTIEAKEKLRAMHLGKKNLIHSTWLKEYYKTHNVWNKGKKGVQICSEESKRKMSLARQTKILQEKGWLVLRYWEHEINDNAEGCVDEIEDNILRKLGGTF